MGKHGILRTRNEQSIPHLKLVDLLTTCVVSTYRYVTADEYRVDGDWRIFKPSRLTFILSKARLWLS